MAPHAYRINPVAWQSRATRIRPLPTFPSLFHDCTYYSIPPDEVPTSLMFATLCLHRPCSFCLKCFLPFPHPSILLLQLPPCLHWIQLIGPVPSTCTCVFPFPIRWPSPSWSPAQSAIRRDVYPLCTGGALYGRVDMVFHRCRGKAANSPLLCFLFSYMNRNSTFWSPHARTQRAHYHAVASNLSSSLCPPAKAPSFGVCSTSLTLFFTAFENIWNLVIFCSDLHQSPFHVTLFPRLSCLLARVPELTSASRGIGTECSTQQVLKGGWWASRLLLRIRSDRKLLK